MEVEDAIPQKIPATGMESFNPMKMSFPNFHFDTELSAKIALWNILLSMIYHFLIQS